ncbi:ribonuclease H1-like [Contarinia nasturtii]|uniref:ribonuclease H1-like n=1 Tax=Contarinia nasturtii TaxID=265458 RepID=UPI0012D49E9F|nr:ribonuclease H1-like [Contarinia nasturtii]XP_031634231.1 ribonuclease H1-like [Contarinia nasturtii]XP_031634232.1 ribonuclease H1-like [Contarinia nasturtii]XP_031634233.1 ribonuclease H1-like [Contarinia nasturtii]XP_031634234.1 ribonuclease H1-like [Contarinia nasturtii]XP_031634235.1 ribonuclease H1-like [Contarinia nasturtii]
MGQSASDVYIEGACSNSGAKAGIGVYWKEGDKNNVSSPIRGVTNNNSAEIKAASRAIRDAGKMGISKLRVNTDSKFVLESVKKIPEWKENQWKQSNGKPVPYKKDVKELDRAINRNKQITLDFKHIPAHSGNVGNESADRLAKQGAKRYNGGQSAPNRSIKQNTNMQRRGAPSTNTSANRSIKQNTNTQRNGGPPTTSTKSTKQSTNTNKKNSSWFFNY